MRNAGNYFLGAIGLAIASLAYVYFPTCTDRKATRVVQEEVAKLMKSPSTVSFPERPDVSRVGMDTFVDVRGPVDSQNSFGATIRNTYSARLINSDCKVSGVPIIQ